MHSMFMSLLVEAPFRNVGADRVAGMLIAKHILDQIFVWLGVSGMSRARYGPHVRRVRVDRSDGNQSLIGRSTRFRLSAWTAVTSVLFLLVVPPYMYNPPDFQHEHGLLSYTVAEP